VPVWCNRKSRGKFAAECKPDDPVGSGSDDVRPGRDIAVIQQQRRNDGKGENRHRPFQRPRQTVVAGCVGERRNVDCADHQGCQSGLLCLIAACAREILPQVYGFIHKNWDRPTTTVPRSLSTDCRLISAVAFVAHRVGPCRLSSS